jgi:hypothetical protein
VDAVTEETIHLFSIIVARAESEGGALKESALGAKASHQLVPLGGFGALRISAHEQWFGEAGDGTCIRIQAVHAEMLELMRVEGVHECAEIGGFSGGGASQEGEAAVFAHVGSLQRRRVVRPRASLGIGNSSGAPG